MKKTILAMILLGILIILIPHKTKAQSLLTEFSIGYTTGWNVPSAQFKIGVIGEDEVGGIYCKIQYQLTQRANVSQIIGLHPFISVGTWRFNTGIDYHIGSTDHNDTNTGVHFSYGVQKTFNNNPFVISAEMSGKYLTVSAGIMVAL